MKATRETKFEPITILIETEKEANLMWHLLNVGQTAIDDEYLKDFKDGRNEIEDSLNLFDKFNKIFNVIKS